MICFVINIYSYLTRICILTDVSVSMERSREVFMSVDKYNWELILQRSLFTGKNLTLHFSNYFMKL